MTTIKISKNLLVEPSADGGVTLVLGVSGVIDRYEEAVREGTVPPQYPTMTQLSREEAEALSDACGRRR